MRNPISHPGSFRKPVLLTALFALYSWGIQKLCPTRWYLIDLAVGFLLFGLIGLKYRPNSLRECLRVKPILSGILLANAFVFQMTEKLPGRLTWFILPLFAAGACYISAGLINAMEKYKSSIQLQAYDSSRDKNVPLKVSLFVLLLLCLRWTLNFPYGVSADTQNQLAQIHGEIGYSSVHAIGHTILMKALLSLWDNPTVIILFHLVSLCALVFCFSRVFTKKGIPLWLQAVAFGLFASCSANTFAFYYPWKDTPYAVCVGFLSLLILLLWEQPERFGIGRAVGLGLALAGIILFRLNGIVILLICVPLLLIRLIRTKRILSLITAAVTFSLAVFSVNLYADSVLEVSRPENGFSMQVFGIGVAAALNDSPSEEELAAASEILPVDFILQNYDERNLTTLLWTSEDPSVFSSAPEDITFKNRFVIALGAHKKEVILLYLRLLPKHFSACFRAVCRSTLMIWGYSPTYPEYSFSFWFGTLSLSLIALVFVGKGRLGKKEWLFILPALLNILSIAISTVTNESRYLLPTTLIYPAFLLLILSEQRGKPTEESALQRDVPLPPAKGRI